MFFVWTNRENLLSCSWAEVQKLFQAVGSIPKGNLSTTLFLAKLTIILFCLSGTSTRLVHKSRVRPNLSTSEIHNKPSFICFCPTMWRSDHSPLGRSGETRFMLSVKENTKHCSESWQNTDCDSKTEKERETHQLELHLRLNHDLWVNRVMLSLKVICICGFFFLHILHAICFNVIGFLITCGKHGLGPSFSYKKKQRGFVSFK